MGSDVVSGLYLIQNTQGGGVIKQTAPSNDFGPLGERGF